MNEQQKATALAAFEEAIKAANGQESLAMILGCSQARVSRIKDGTSRLEAEIAARIEKRWPKIPRWKLRPDLFDPPKGAVFKMPAGSGGLGPVDPKGTIATRAPAKAIARPAGKVARARKGK
jgi:DNA-binding transcriptional regulator YdaS (Cro superfamily)